MFRIKHLVFSLLAIIASHQGMAQAPPLFGWQKCLGGTSLDAAQRIISCANEDMLVAGNTQSTNGDVSANHGSRDYWVVRMTPAGQTVWARTYGGSGSDIATSAVELPNGNFIVAGYTSSNNGDVTGNHGNFDTWLICLDAAGNLRWQKAMGGTNNDFCESVASTPDGGFILGGSSYSNNGNVSGNHGDQDFWIVKTDSVGVIQWQRSVGGSAFEQCFTICTLADGSYAAAGVSNSNNGDVSGNRGQNDCMIVHLDGNGNILWTRLFGGSSMESAFNCIQNTSGNLILAGYTNSSDSDVTVNRGSSDVWLMEVSLAGNLLMSRTYGGSNSDIAYSVAQNAGGYLLAASTFSLDIDVSFNHGGEDVLLIQADLAGNKVWAKTYGGSAGDHPASFIGDYASGFKVCGYTSSNNGDVTGNHGNSDIWVCNLACLAPSMAFTNSLDSMCVNSTAAFNSTSVNVSEYAWTVNGTTVSTSPNLSYSFNATGQFDVMLTGRTCMMSDAYSKAVLVSPVPNPVITASSNMICNNDSVILASTAGDSYSWSNGSSSQVIRVGAAGTYNVIVSVGGCAGMSLPVSVSSHAMPTFSLGNDTAFCSGSNFWLTAPSGYASYTWQDGSPYRSFIATMPGTCYVTVSDGTCSFTDTIVVDTVDCSLLVAGFTASRTMICQYDAIDFQDQSRNAVSWQWSFPGGTPASSTSQYPTNIVYNSPGAFDVNLIVTNANGSTALYRQGYITVNPMPVKPTFYATGPVLICSQGYQYQWYLNNNPIAGANAQVYTATASGNYTVQVISQEGCSNMSDPQYLTVTGISTIHNNTFDVYPNPTRGRIFVRTPASRSASLFLEVLDTEGSRVHAETIVADGSEKMLNLEKLAAGMYFVHAVWGDQSVYSRIQVIK